MFLLLSDNELLYLAKHALVASYKKDEVIVEEKQHPMDKLFLVLKGKVNMEKESQDKLISTLTRS